MKIVFNIAHEMHYFPANENAEKYIKETVTSILSKLPELSSIKFKGCKESKSVTCTSLFNVHEANADRVNVIVNRINKTGRRIGKKFKTTFGSLDIEVSGKDLQYVQEKQ